MRAVIFGVMAGLVALAAGVADAQNLVLRFKVPGLEGVSAGPTQPARLQPDPSGAFVTVWDTNQPGISDNQTVTLPLVSDPGDT